MKALILLAVLHMLGNPRARHYHERASAFAFHAEKAIRAERTDIDPVLVAAVAGRESSWLWKRGGKILTGAAGEVGYMQIHPAGRALALCRDLDVQRPVDNVRCGIRLLEEARATCGGGAGFWLGRYQGQPCGESEYAERVLTLRDRSRPALALVP